MLNIRQIFVVAVCALNVSIALADIIQVGDERIKNIRQISLGTSRACALTDKGVECWGTQTISDVLPEGLDEIARIAVSAHQCVLTVSGIVSCYGGTNYYGENNVPTDLADVKDVVVGPSYSCAVKQDTLKCWGTNYGNQLSIPSTLSGIKQVSAGASTICALDSNGVTCWGSATYGMTTVPVLNNPKQVVAGSSNVCALDDDGMQCWGNHAASYLNKIPKEVVDVQKIGLGSSHVCALIKAGTVHCWGASNYNGELNVPSNLKNVTDLYVNETTTCAITVDGPVCWGDSYYGLSRVPANYLKTTKLVSGGYHVCSLLTDKASCFGSNKETQLRLAADSYQQLAPGLKHTCSLSAASKVTCVGDWNITTVPALTKPKLIASGDSDSCAITDKGIICWGTNDYEQHTVPATVTDATQLAMGRGHVCALTPAAGVQCWGQESVGQTKVPANLGAVTQIVAGGSTTCARLATGGIQCWGDNSSNQTDIPVDLKPATQVSAGGSHVCALTSEGVFCWGRNTYGQTEVPTDLKNPIQISTGYAHTCALTDEGIVCWGLISK